MDFNEEFSALYGGYLQDQTQYLGQCVRKVLSFYRNLPNGAQSVVLIGHSMGGKIAQALLTDFDNIDLVNTVIMLSTPVDKPVINIDNYFEIFYRNINDFWSFNRGSINLVTNTTNTCCLKHIGPTEISPLAANDNDEQFPLNKKLLITIGGGSRDILVHSALTMSKFSDIHAIVCLRVFDKTNLLLMGHWFPISGHINTKHLANHGSFVLRMVFATNSRYQSIFVQHNRAD